MTIWIDYASRIDEQFPYCSCALLVVDVQRAFCAPDGRTGLRHSNRLMQALPNRINTFVDRFCASGGLPVYLRSVPSVDRATPADRWLNELKSHPRPASSSDPELELYGLKLPRNAVTIDKCSDGFAHSNLKAVLDANDISSVLICGVRTEICVRRVAERSESEGYRVFVLRDLCATRDANQSHAEQALLFLNAYTGIVLDSDKMLKLLC